MPETAHDSSVASAGKAVKRAYRRRLSSLDNVRTALADVVRKLEVGHVEPGNARAMVYALATLAHLIKESERTEQRGAADSESCDDDGAADGTAVS